MAEAEKFDIMKLLKSPFTGLYWTKTLMLGLGLLVLSFLGYAVYKAYIKKPPPTQTQHQAIQSITVADGGCVNLGQVQQQTEKKRSWWIPAPFVEIYCFTETDGQKGVGTKVGGRFEW